VILGNCDPAVTPPASEHRWYHYGETAIVDVTNYDDITHAIEDGRLDRITDEHTRYVKETDRETQPL